jgi:endonuclease/exonuclease/phosphatase family metal-dependent hydrolase
VNRQSAEKPVRSASPWYWLRWLLLGLPLAAIWVLLASRPGAHVEGCAQGCATVAPRGDATLRVLSLNILHGFPRFYRLRARLDRIAAEIRRLDVDVACLQEASWVLGLGSAARYLARETGLNHLYLRANGNRWAILFEEGEVILSRYPLHDAAFRVLTPRAGFFEHRVVLHAVAVTPWGPVDVFATHLTHGDPAVNRAQAASLQAYVARSAAPPAIVAGDFNATEDTPQIRALGWIDTYRVERNVRVHPDQQGFTCCVDDLAGGPEQRLSKRIDYLFLVPGTSAVEVVDSQVVLDRPVHLEGGWLWPSDHAGVLTTLSLQ